MGTITPPKDHCFATQEGDSKLDKALRMFWKLDKAYLRLHTECQHLRNLNTALFACIVVMLIGVVIIAVSLLWGGF